MFGLMLAKEHKLSVTSCISWILLTIITATIAITLLCKYPAWDSKKKDSNGRPNKPRHEKWFYVWLIGLSTLGGFWALFLPLALNQKFDGPNADGNQLRLHLLYITGGVLALTTLGETHRKNTLEKHKNDQDHTRQVHAERRSRYTTAIEQLSSDKASIRLGGVYALAGLVDEWLSDEKTTPSLEERRKEGQVIINNLCAYIRSPFLLAERAEQLDEDYTKDLQIDFDGDKENFEADKQTFKQHKATLEEERQVRLSIIQEIRERLRKNNESGSWSDFDYDFSNTVFFYLTDFSDSLFGASSNFTQATFTKGAGFPQVAFTRSANFSRAKFLRSADFCKAKFTGYASFSGASFTRNAHFCGAELTTTDFSGVAFTGSVDFSGVAFTGSVDFSGVAFTGSVDFSGAELTTTYFTGTKFTRSVDFNEAIFKYDPIFRAIAPWDGVSYKAWFSHKVEPKNYNFEISHNSPYKIETEEQEHDGVKFIIPKGTELFDPDEPSDLEDDDES